MQHWFDGLEPVIKQMKHHNIYNFDETGFVLGQQPSRTSSIGRRRARAEIPDTRESLTSIECISADGSHYHLSLSFKAMCSLRDGSTSR
jgi:hypothetical protein